MSTVYSSEVNRWRTRMDYSVSYSGANATISISGGFESIANGFDIPSGRMTSTAKINNSTVGSDSSASFYSANGATVYKQTVSGSKTIAMTDSAQSIPISVAVSQDYWRSGTGTASTNVSIPARHKVTFNANGGSGAPAAQYKYYGTILTLSSTKPTRNGYTFKGWATSSTSTTVAYKAGAQYGNDTNVTLYAIWERYYEVPAAPTNCLASYSSDTKAMISWKNNSDIPKDYAELYVERQVGSGSWSQVAKLSASTTGYTDTIISANGIYRWRVRAHNSAGYSSYATSGYVYTTPVAPTGIALSRTEDNGVLVVLTNPANSGQKVQVQRSSDKSTWDDAAETTAASLVDSPGGGTWYYRARNVCSFTDGSGTSRTLSSGWFTSDAIATIMPPAAPTLVRPASSAVLSTAAETLDFEWRHNPLDGSSQTAAQLRFSTDGGTSWQEYDVSGDVQTHAIENDIEPNTTVIWQVRTKGIDENWGDWSASMQFLVCSPPSVSITSPGAEPIVAYPLVVAFDYADASGRLVSATARVTSGELTKSFLMEGTELLIPSTEMELADGEPLVVEIRALSSSTLSTLASVSTGVSFVAPAEPDASIEVDRQRASVSIIVHEGAEESDGVPNTMSLAVFRLSAEDGTDPVLLAEGVAPGTNILDPTPPLDVAITYRVVAYAESGVPANHDVALLVPSGGHHFVNYGQGYQGVARALVNPSRSEKHQKEVKTFDVVRQVGGFGGVLPVSFFGSSMGYETTLKGLVWASGFADERRDFDPLATDRAWADADRWRGPVILRVPFAPSRRVRKCAMTGLSLGYDATGGKWHHVDMSATFTEVS